ncbi:MAG: pilus assembly protein [Actinomycetota bacterium]|nr:pilus assembly protein [Actinomycetota bacterium]
MTPVLIAMVMGLVWLISLGAAQVRVVDAARETARAVARDEPHGRAVELGGRIAPEGSRFLVSERGATVRVHVIAPVAGPGGLFELLPPVEVTADAIAAKEVW